MKHRTITARRYVFMCTLLLCPAAWAQDTPPPPEQEPAPEEVEAAMPDLGRPTPLPGEDVLRPTKHGIRMTPGLARGFAMQFVKEELGSLGLDPGQRDDMTDRVSRRMMELSYDRGKDGAAAIEFLYERMIDNDGALDPKGAKEAAERLRPGADMFRDFFDGLQQDGEDILDEDQMQQLREKTTDALKAIDKFDGALQRWEKGDIKEGETLQGALKKAEGSSREQDEAKMTEPRRNAERQARWRINEHGPDNWQRFLGSCRVKFEFTGEQFAAGQKILQEYRVKAKEIMTDEWTEKLRKLLVLSLAEYALRDGEKERPLGPWKFHLDRQIDQMQKPLKDMGREFRAKILALATDEQRAKVLQDLQDFGTEHGVPVEDMSAATLGLTVQVQAQAAP